MRAGIVFAAAGLAAACSARDNLPSELYRTWRNPAPAYRDRYFELREGWMIFGTGPYTTEMLPIETVEAEREGATTEFTIGYRAQDGALVPLRIVYTPGPPARLQLGSRSDFWIPEPDRPADGSS